MRGEKIKHDNENLVYRSSDTDVCVCVCVCVRLCALTSVSRSAPHVNSWPLGSQMLGGL